MSIAFSIAELTDRDVAAARRAAGVEVLERGFGVGFTLLDGDSGDVIAAAADQPACDWSARAELCREVARRESGELLDDEDPLLVWAVPLSDPGGGSYVAAAVFVARRLRPAEDLSRAACALGMDVQEALPWAARQNPWMPDALRRMSESLLAQIEAGRRIARLERETRDLSIHLTSTYEEISLLYRLTHNLKISESDEELGRLTLEWMGEVVPAEALAIELIPCADSMDSLSQETRRKSVLLTRGPCPVDKTEFGRLMEHLGAGAASQPIVVNPPVSDRDDWPCPQVRQLIAVSLAEGENLFGWLVAFNHVSGDEFGTVEASLLNSVAAILGIHSGNIALYQQQSELMAGIIRALTAAIDAKDPYTCGHSDRVARIAVRLAQELGCDGTTLHTIYLSGLLHDIGKIGINDSVLRKPGKLSEAEFEHIKSHSQIGHKILRDLKKLDNVLPVILHHHESWDGAGYPYQLQAEQIPLAARIVAVADSFDAMGSDRPYRKGMPDEKIDQIFRAGASRQWDGRVVDAFFRARDDLRRIAHSDQTGAKIDLRQWT